MGTVPQRRSRGRTPAASALCRQLSEIPSGNNRQVILRRLIRLPETNRSHSLR